MSINNQIRTRNYKLTLAQLESSKARINELEAEVQQLQQDGEKAEAYELLADAVGLKNTLNKLVFFKEITEEVDPYFDTKTNSKLLNVKSISATKNETNNKIKIKVEMDADVPVYNASGLLIDTIQASQEFDEIEIIPASEPWTCGDITKCNNIEIAGGENDVVNGLKIVSPYVKLENLNELFGPLTTNSTVFTITCKTVSGDPSTYYLVLEATADVIEAKPVPAQQ